MSVFYLINFKIKKKMKHQRIIEFRFLLTPFASTLFIIKDVYRKRYYIFGFKIIDLLQLFKEEKPKIVYYE